MDKNVQQSMIPGSIAWFMQKKPVRISTIISIAAAVLYLAFCFWFIIADDINPIFAIIFLIFLVVSLPIIIIGNKRVSHDRAIYIKENGYLFKVVPTPNSGSGVMYGGLAGGLIGAAIGAAIDASSNGNITPGAGVLGMVHTRIGMVHQISEILQIDDNDDVYVVTATLIQHLRGGKTTKPKKQKLYIDKRILAADSLVAEFSAIQAH